MNSLEDFICLVFGIIDFMPFFKENDTQGIENYIVERDNVPDGTGYLKLSGKYQKEIRL